MSDFDDANVDKDLLSQIFSNDGSGSIEDIIKDDLFEDSSREKQETVLEEEASEQDTTEELPEDVPAEPELMEAAEEETAGDEEEKEEKPSEDSDAQNEGYDEMTVIARGTSINGGVSSNGSLKILGNIEGDVDCLGQLYIYGKVSGNVTGSEVVIKTDRLNGNIECEGELKIEVGTVIIGDVSGAAAVIAGAVKGNIDVNGPVTIDSTAIIKGNITAKSIQVNNGAVVDGYCSLNYAGVALDDIFAEK